MNTAALEDLQSDTPKSKVIQKVRSFIAQNHLTIDEANIDEQKPWGFYHYIDTNQLDRFIDLFFDSYRDHIRTDLPCQPKILAVAPHARLSWQYHHRRSEIWTVIWGPVAVTQSDSDDQSDPNTHHSGKLVELKKGERHRLIGLENWGVVAEIWHHTDPDHPSDETDIIRLADDYQRN